MELRELVEEAKREGIIIIALRERLSESYYNYKYKNIVVIYRNDESPWEESDDRKVIFKVIECGAFQEIPFSSTRVIEELRELTEKNNINIEVVHID